MKYCMNCGTSLPDDAKFCFNCGTKQPEKEVVSPIEVEEEKPVVEEPLPERVEEEVEPTVEVEKEEPILEEETLAETQEQPGIAGEIVEESVIEEPQVKEAPIVELAPVIVEEKKEEVPPEAPHVEPAPVAPQIEEKKEPDKPVKQRQKTDFTGLVKLTNIELWSCIACVMLVVHIIFSLIGIGGAMLATVCFVETILACIVSIGGLIYRIRKKDPLNDEMVIVGAAAFLNVIFFICQIILVA